MSIGCTAELRQAFFGDGGLSAPNKQMRAAHETARQEAPPRDLQQLSSAVWRLSACRRAVRHLRSAALMRVHKFEVQAIFCRRRHQLRRPPLAKIRPGRPAPTMGPGTAAALNVEGPEVLIINVPAVVVKPAPGFKEAAPVTGPIGVERS